MNGYNRLAPFYDLLKKIVFGNALNEAAISHTPSEQNTAKILVVGGGTGYILDHLPKTSSVDFVDDSSKMILRARKRKHPTNVHFHCLSYFDFIPTSKYDTVYFNFFLDLFSEGEIMTLLNKVNKELKPNGRLIVTDFKPITQQTRHWKKLLLRTVIVFFKYTVKHKRSTIVNIKNTLQNADFQPQTSKDFFSGMVFASIWKKTMY